MSTTATFRGTDLLGDVNVKNWTASSSAGFQILNSQKKISGLRFEVDAKEISQVSPSQTAFAFETIVISEISTEATMLAVINFGLTHTGKVGTLVIGSTTISANAAFAGITPIIDHKKGYILKWSFTLIGTSSGGGSVGYTEKLRNPSFEALGTNATTDPVEGWTLAPGGGTIVQTQMFGNEELGDGQFALKVTDDTTTHPSFNQTVLITPNLTTTDYKYTYWKFSVDARLENGDLTQKSSSCTLFLESSTSSAFTRNIEFTLVSGYTRRLEIVAAYNDIYGDGVGSANVIVVSTGVTGDVIFYDNALLEDVIL